MTTTIPANFISVFKIGDNINFNLSILELLYNVYNRETVNSNLLIKPIVMINTSIIEAVLYDFIKIRIKKRSLLEQIGYLKYDVILSINKKKLDRFEHYINQAQIYDFFDASDTNFYQALHRLQAVRNRIHIQNDKNFKPANESELFTKQIKKVSEKVLEKVLITMYKEYRRPAPFHNYVNDFVLPWDSYFLPPNVSLQYAVQNGLI